MHHSKDPLFQILFNQLAEARLILKAESPDFTVISANTAWKALSGTLVADLLPRLFPEQDITKLFLTVMDSAEVLTKAAVADHQLTRGRWLELEIQPILDASGARTEYIMCTLFDVTARISGEQQLTEQLAASNEELMAINEELLTAQERLRQLNLGLEQRVAERTAELKLSEQKARFIVEDAPVAIALLAGRELVIESANKLMLALWGKPDVVLGKTLSMALPELEGQAFFGILDHIFDTGNPFYGTEVKASIEYSGVMEDRYFNFVYHPVKDAGGTTQSIMVVATDVSDQVQARKVIEESAHQLQRMVMTTPIGLTILKGPDLGIEIANAQMLQIWGRNSAEVLGKNLTDVFPELVNQPFPEMLRHIFETGERIAKPASKAKISLTDGTEKEIYVDFSYDPLFDRNGNVEAILASVTDVTDLIESKQILQQRQEELEALNEEFQAANEELIVTNEELSETQEDLKTLYGRLKESEIRFRGLFDQSPIGMCFLKGEDLVIDLVNENMLKIWGRSREEVIGKPHRLARPELKGQPINDWLEEVYRTGVERVNNELKVNLYEKGGLREAYVHSLYHPLKDSKGQVNGLLVILTDITQWVQTRKQIEWAQEQLRMAVQSAELGTWYMSTTTREFVPSGRLKEFFGFRQDEAMGFEDAISLIAEDYRESVAKAIEETLSNGGRFELEYPVNGHEDGQLRWLRATGKLYPATPGAEAHFSGTVLDITARKLEEIRKNDFIAIVSHELKTPLTSLKGYLQLMQVKSKDAAEHQFFSAVSDKSLAQVEKMHALIKGFLDVARLESAKLVLNLQVMQMEELIAEAAEEADLMYHHHDIVVESCEQVEVLADRDKIAQVLGNLLSNAIKYSPLGKLVVIRCHVVNQELIVEVQDQGMGIKQPEIGRLFDRFYRVETKHTTAISGFGIGLYLCAEIIRLHQGRIWAESEVGVGSSFFFSLPLSRD